MLKVIAPCAVQISTAPTTNALHARLARPALLGQRCLKIVLYKKVMTEVLPALPIPIAILESSALVQIAVLLS